jgi:peptidyl-prolyl cis-trans isomerase D
MSISDSEVSKFFTDNNFRYTVPPRVDVSYVEFPASAYVGQVSVTDAEVRQFFDANPSEFPKPVAKDSKDALSADAQFKQLEPFVKQRLLHEKAKQIAVKAASELAYAIYDGKVSRQGLEAFLSSRQLKTSSLAPFTNEAGPAELGGSRAIASAAFELNADRFYSEGLPSPNGAVVLFWKNTLPSYQPNLAEVREKVRADAIDNQRRIKFVTFGRSLKAGIERRLKEGESFEKAAAEAASPVPVEVKSYPAFTLRTPPKDLDTSLFAALDHLDKGGVSDLQADADKGVIAYAADKKVPAVDPTSSRYAQIRAQLAAAYARTTSSQAIREIVEGELKRTDTAAK